MNKIRTMLVEDDIDWVTAIEDYLLAKDDIYLEATANDRESAIKTATMIHPDVIVMDINLSGNKCDGIYAAAEIIAEIDTKILMLTCLSEEEIVLNSFTAGAINFLSKENYTHLADAIRSAKVGNSPYEVLLKEYSRLKEEEQLKPLTGSEKEVFHLLENGYSRSKIQNELYKSENTIKTQIKSILKKMGVNRVGQAIKKVHQKGFI
ncbi:response regulator transcription factor [Clostridium sp. BNL1100]|uniref:response regulator transcription factor n=1 Tax=Clostridium sp. BNL1100 TaxID=755731 RepID=UPI00024A7EEF|nr:response regulator transcription factor [Clostridium sp. BNL1100]AEY65016.1 response regulator containing a CheY-like receiver domain and an HTH DNA-binding domain [Clostridium sp. BNL1100]